MLASILLLLLQSAPAPPAPGWDELPVLVWRLGWQGRALPEELVAPFGGTNVERHDEAAWARERGLCYYVGHAPGRDELHIDTDSPAWLEREQAWYESRDEELLVREPCLNDPATREQLLETLARSMDARGGDHGLGLSLGDEVSLTPGDNPSDVCRSPFCEQAWRERAAALGLPARAPTTDEVRLALHEGDYDRLGAWLARRRFHQEVLLEVLAELASAARRESPHTPVGLLGINGQSAFGGVAVERLVGFLDFLECYPTGYAQELLFTLRALRGEERSPRSLATIFCDATEPDEASLQAWEHVLRGGDGLVLWSDSALQASPEHRERLARSVARMRELRARFPHLRCAPEGIAIVHDADTVALSWLRDALLDGPTWPRRLFSYHAEHGRREMLVRHWLELFRHAGYQPGALPFAEIDAGLARRFPLLILPRHLALDAAEVARLQAYLAAGGTLLVDEDFAWVDRSGRPRSEAQVTELLAGLRERAPERVLEAPTWIERMPQRGDESFRVYLGRARELAARAGVRPAPWRVEGLAGILSWRSLWTPDPDSGGWLCAAIPAQPLELSGAPVPLQVLVHPEEGLRVEWLHPRGGMLEAGDAAVFRLRPR
jgi:hypothetical protein